MQLIRSIFFAFIATTFFLISCRRYQQVKAKIFERKQVSSNRLIIRYRYKVANKTYTGSANLKNNVIGNDSINIIIDPDNPERNLPDFTK